MKRSITSLISFVLLLSSPLCVSSQVVDKRPPLAERCFTSTAVEELMQDVAKDIADAKLRSMFLNCFPNTLDTTVRHDADSCDTFVITGDINAMWLRDSSAQLFPYLFGVKTDDALRQLIAGAIRRQARCLLIDPYANAFNHGATGGGWDTDLTDMRPELHERKWEIDSHCYVIRLAYHYWKATGDTAPFDADWAKAMHVIYNTLREQQRVNGQGSYNFQRRSHVPTDTQQGYGWGAPVKPCGLIFSAFRPSDDATTFGFLIPSNMFAVVSLRQLAEMSRDVLHDKKFAQRCTEFAAEVDAAIRHNAIVQHPRYGSIYAYEVDGYGNHLLMDDANVPSLLSASYLGYCQEQDSIYQNTRRFVWSTDNPYFYSGRDGEGIGGPHVGVGYAWPMSIIMRGLTTDDADELRWCIRQLRNTDGGTGMMHESFHVDNHHRFTRKWFAWANNLFGELIIKAHKECPDILRSSFDESGWINYATFNVRYQNDHDGTNSWENRRDSLAHFILAQQLDIVGMQEVLHQQRLDLQVLLPDYDYVGVGRDNGKTKGEYAPIFYRRSRFKVLDSGTFWLSEHPNRAGSIGWDGACCRIATWAKMTDRETGKTFLAVNTHFDHVGTEARRRGALLIIDRIRQLGPNLPVILTGDFNVTEDSEAYRTITQPAAVDVLAEQSGSPATQSGQTVTLLDAHKVAHRTPGQTYTWHDFGRLPLHQRSKIDFLFITPNVEADYSWIPQLNVRRGISIPYMSDHNPIITRLRF